jgi:hypothetical protein
MEYSEKECSDKEYSGNEYSFHERGSIEVYCKRKSTKYFNGLLMKELKNIGIM